MTKEQKELLDALLKLDSGLTDWEQEFIDNLAINFKERDLSEKQENALTKIARKFNLLD